MTSHPHRRRALLYFFSPIILLAISVSVGLSANKYDEKSHISHVLGTLSGVTLLLVVVFIIPFFIYAVKYWLSKTEPVTLPAADTQPHDLSVQFSTSFWAQLFGNVFSQKGILTWVNSSKIIRLTGGAGEQTSVVFEVPYRDIQKLEVDLSMLIIKVAGKSYACFPYSTLMQTTTAAGVVIDSQASAIALGVYDVQKSGVSELAERLRLEGVKVIYTKVGRALEFGFDLGFLFVCIVSILLVVLVS